MCVCQSCREVSVTWRAQTRIGTRLMPRLVHHIHKIIKPFAVEQDTYLPSCCVISDSQQVALVGVQNLDRFCESREIRNRSGTEDLSLV